MRKRFAGRFTLTTAAMVIAAFWAAQAQERGAAPAVAGQPQAAPQGRGRGPAEPPLPTPRLSDGTVNLGRVVGDVSAGAVLAQLRAAGPTEVRPDDFHSEACRAAAGFSAVTAIAQHTAPMTK